MMVSKVAGVEVDEDAEAMVGLARYEGSVAPVGGAM